MFEKSSDKDKDISIFFLADEQHGPMDLPVVYSTPELPGTIRGYVILNLKTDIKAKDLSLVYRAKANSCWTRNYGQTTITWTGDHTLQEEHWNIPLTLTKSGAISKGQCRFDFQVQLLPGLPSSVKGRHGWFRYRCTATLARSFPHSNLEIKKDVWVFSTCLPSPKKALVLAAQAAADTAGSTSSSSSSSGQLSSSVLSTTQPKVYQGLFESYLPYTVTIPSDTLYQGQSFPLTIKFDPFQHGSGLYGQDLVIVKGCIKLKQYQLLYSTRGASDKAKKELVTLDLNNQSEWPSGSQGWERTIQVTLPEAPVLSATIHTNVVVKTHCLKLILMVKRGGQPGEEVSDKEAKEFRCEMNVVITAPRPPTDSQEEEIEEQGDDDDVVQLGIRHDHSHYIHHHQQQQQQGQQPFEDEEGLPPYEPQFMVPSAPPQSSMGPTAPPLSGLSDMDQKIVMLKN